MTMKKTESTLENTAVPDAARATFHAQLLPLEKVIPSPTNPRKRFDPAAQEELQGSMRVHGFTMSTLLVRPQRDAYFLDDRNAENGQFFVMRRTAAGVEESVEMPPTREKADALLAELQGRYELVTGERRWRAARAVGIAEVPCIVREMSDQEVLEIQLIENVQREDLTALEAALGFRRLLALRDGEGKAIHTTQTLHERTGKSVRHIERHVRLCAIADDPALTDFLKAFEDGIVGFKHALAVARIPNAKLRAKLAREVLAPKYEEAPLSVRKTETLVQRDYMRDLRGVTFDLKDAQLVPVQHDADGQRVMGGACSDCPLRLGNAANLWDGEIPSGMANMCLNPGCLAAKEEEGWRRWQESETQLEKKRRALSEEECRRLYRYGDQLEWNSAYVDLADKPDSSDLKAGKEAPGTWKKLTKGAEVEVVVVRDRNNKVHELVSRELAITAAEANGHKVFKTTEKKSASNGSSGAGAAARQQTPEERAAAAEEEADSEEIEFAEDAAVAAAVAAPRAKLPAGFWPEVLQLITEEYYGSAPERLEQRRGWKLMALQSEFKKLTENEQAAAISELLFWSAAVDSCGPEESALLKMYGIDGKALRKAAREKVEAEQKRRKELRADIERQAVNAGLIGGGKLEALLAKHEKDLGIPKGAKPAQIRDDATLEKIVALLRKLAGVKGDGKLMARARELRGAGKIKSVPALADAMKVSAEVAGQLWDALIDEEHDAKATPEGRAKLAAGVKKKKASAK